MDVKDSNGNVPKEGDEAVEGNSDKVKGLRLKPEFLKKI
jgi:uncharacterized Zn ribbon protein